MWEFSRTGDSRQNNVILYDTIDLPKKHPLSFSSVLLNVVMNCIMSIGTT